MIKSFFQSWQIAIFALISGLWMIYVLIQFNVETYIPYFEPLQKNTSDFFVRCVSGNCSSLILPLLSYLLLPNQSSVSYLYLWMLIIYMMGIYLLCQIIKYSKFSHQNLLATSILVCTAILESKIPFHPEYLPCTFAAFIGVFGAKNKRKGWQYFALAAILFHIQLGTFILLCLLVSNLFVNPTKDLRVFILELLRLLLIGYAIICLYLILIDYDFLQFYQFKNNTIFPTQIQQNLINTVFIYLGSLFAILFIHAEQSKN